MDQHIPTQPAPAAVQVLQQQESLALHQGSQHAHDATQSARTRSYIYIDLHHKAS
jgi:hypothetical protein